MEKMIDVVMQFSQKIYKKELRCGRRMKTITTQGKEPADQISSIP